MPRFLNYFVAIYLIAWVGSDPMTLEPVINPKTAKTVVLRMPPLLLVCPDKVIQ
jgi:Protein of unknown function (DUF3096)